MTTIQNWVRILAILTKYPTAHDGDYIFPAEGCMLLDTDPNDVSAEDLTELEELGCLACLDGHEQGDGPCFQVFGS